MLIFCLIYLFTNLSQRPGAFLYDGIGFAIMPIGSSERRTLIEIKAACQHDEQVCRTAIRHGSNLAIMLQIYKKYLEKGVAFPCLGVALLSFRCRIGGGMRHLKGAIPDKNVSFLLYFSKINNFCFQSSKAAFVAG